MRSILAAALAAMLFAWVPLPRSQAAEPRSRTLEGHPKGVSSVAFSPDSKSLASAGDDGTIKLWDVAKGAVQRTLSHGERAFAVAFSPDGKKLAVGGGVFYHGSLTLYDPQSGEMLWKKKDIAGTDALHLAFSPDGTLVATPGHIDDSKHHRPAVRLWDVKTGDLKRTFNCPGRMVFAVAISPDGKCLATGGSDMILLWNLPAGTLTDKFTSPGNPWSIAFSPDSKTLASCTHDAVEFLDPRNGESKRTLVKRNSGATLAAFSPDGRHFATGSYDQVVRIWEVSSGELKQLLASDNGGGSSVAFSADGKYLAVGRRDGVVRLWNMPELLKPTAGE